MFVDDVGFWIVDWFVWCFVLAGVIARLVLLVSVCWFNVFVVGDVLFFGGFADLGGFGLKCLWIDFK